jgi:hypothetical protein
MLYALRYQKQATSNIASLVASLKEQGVSVEDAQVSHIAVMLPPPLMSRPVARLRCS